MVGVAGRGVAVDAGAPRPAAAAGAAALAEPRLAGLLALVLALLLALVLALLAAGDLLALGLAELLARLLAGVLVLVLGLVVLHADDGRREALLLEPQHDAHRVHGAHHRQRALLGVDVQGLDPWVAATPHTVSQCISLDTL